MEKRKAVEESLRVTPEKITTSGDSATWSSMDPAWKHPEWPHAANIASIYRKILSLLDIITQILTEEDLKWPPDASRCCQKKTPLASLQEKCSRDQRFAKKDA